MAKVMVDIELSLDVTEINKFKELADQMDKTVPEVVEMCMLEKRDEMLDMFLNNIPDEEIEG